MRLNTTIMAKMCEAERRSSGSCASTAPGLCFPSPCLLDGNIWARAGCSLDDIGLVYIIREVFEQAFERMGLAATETRQRSMSDQEAWGATQPNCPDTTGARTDSDEDWAAEVPG